MSDPGPPGPWDEELEPDGGLADEALAPPGLPEDGSDLVPDEHPANRFLGREFLAWVWYRVERDFGRIEVPALGSLDFWVDDRLVMRGRGEDPQTASFRGGAPSSTEEARAALRAGKVPDEARIGLRLGDREYTLSLRGETLDVAALKVPQVVKKGDSEAVLLDRMFLFEEAVAAVSAVYEVFLQERLHPSWATHALPRIRAWMRPAPAPRTDEAPRA